MADGADWWASYMVALSGTFLVVYLVCAAEHDIFLFFRGDIALFRNELLMSFSTMPSMISSISLAS